MAANSGARIGLAEEVMNHFNVAWIDKGNPSKGIKYLYLDSEIYKQLHQNGRKSVITEEIVEEGEIRHTDIIGSKDGLGVESLKDSGLIAGITSRAYEVVELYINKLLNHVLKLYPIKMEKLEYDILIAYQKYVLDLE
ncbi:18319_t:CDS:2 [Funneliformis geosporum]|uniref:18319_t:CDS:1 n=1 Tax=Funneliformis geosporum TaxID=1117311 RepID=A0A9W4WUB2_9GLOM|nr:18319_t:CDS:2 [Funneliformis geosporum]